MRRRIRTFLLAVFMLLSLVPMALAADGDRGLCLTATLQDDVIVVQAALADCEGVTNGRLVVRYDPEAVTFERAVPAGDGWIASVNTGVEDAVAFAWAASSLPGGTAPVVELRFTLNHITALTETAFTGEITELYRSGQAVSLTAEEARAEAPIVCGQVPFTDIDGWYRSCIEKAYRAGLVKGVTDTRFAPSQPMTRGMFVTILHRLAGTPQVEGENPFADVAAGRYYTEAVIWASSTGVIEGISQTQFNPNGYVTRQQMVAMLYRYARNAGAASDQRADLSVYPDADSVASWAQEAMQWAVAEKIILGSDGALQPARGATRAEAVAVVCRFAGF